MKQLDFIKANGEVVEKEAIHQWLDRSVKYITNGAYSLTLTRVVKRRSLQQNRLMWMWFKCVELELGQPSQDIHDYYCKKFFSREIANPVTGEVETVYSGTRGLNTAQMSDFLALFCHKCGADLLIKKLNANADITPKEIKRRKLSSEYTPINIKIDYTVLDIQKYHGLIDDFNYEAFKTELEKIADYFKKIVLVQHELFDQESLLKGIKEQCYSSITDLGEIDSYDLIVYPQVDTEEEFITSETIAAASHCLLSEVSQRPIVGIILLNKNLNTKNDLEYYIRNALFHEFFHILGFNFLFFKNKQYEENSYTYLNSPKLLEKAKIHFGCDDIKGIRLEDQGESGTVGSHWDARFMQGELMIGEDYSEVVMSDMTLAFLEDLGYYKVNYYTGGLFRFGKNQGCSFLEKKCIYSEGTLFPNEFCYESNKPFCTGSLTSKGTCYIVKYKEDLPTNYRYFADSKVGGKKLADYCPISFFTKYDDDYNYPMNCAYGKKKTMMKS